MTDTTAGPPSLGLSAPPRSPDKKEVNVLERERIQDEKLHAKLLIKDTLEHLDFEKARIIGIGKLRPRPTEVFADSLIYAPSAVAVALCHHGAKWMYQAAKHDQLCHAGKFEDARKVLCRSPGRIEFYRKKDRVLSDDQIRQLLLMDGPEAVLAIISSERLTVEGSAEVRTTFCAPWNSDKICGIARAVCAALEKKLPGIDPAADGTEGFKGP